MHAPPGGQKILGHPNEIFQNGGGPSCGCHSKGNQMEPPDNPLAAFPIPAPEAYGLFYCWAAADNYNHCMQPSIFITKLCCGSTCMYELSPEVSTSRLAFDAKEEACETSLLPWAFLTEAPTERRRKGHETLGPKPG